MSGITITRGIQLWTASRCANWKVASCFVNMGGLLLLGTYPSGAYMRNSGLPMRRRQFLQISCLSPVGINHALNSQAATADQIPLLKDAPQLFVDLDHVEALDNVQRVFHAAEKHPHNPVLRKVKPWENDRGTWGSVIYDEQERIFKAWYGGKSGRQKEYRPGSLSECSVLCYATSTDGVHWDRPARWI